MPAMQPADSSNPLAIAPPQGRWRWPLYLRPAEYIALMTMGVGVWAQSSGQVQLVFTTSFIRRGMQLFFVAAAVALVARTVVHVRRTGAATAGRGAVDMLGFVRDWAPMVLLLVAFENSLFQVPRFNPRLLDMDLNRLDSVLFFGNAEAAIQALVRTWATPSVMWCYDALYAYPVILGIWLFAVGKRWQGRDFLVAFVISGFIGYLGYVVVPAIGPAYYFGRPLPSVPGGGYAYDYAARFAVLASQPPLPRNCYPSLHTGWAVVVAVFAWRQARVLFWIFLIPLLILITATLYMRFHYLIDVMAGTGLAIAVCALVPRLHVAWERARCGQPPEGVPPLPPLRGRRLAFELVLPLFVLVAPAVWLAGFSGLHAEEPKRKQEFLAASITSVAPVPQHKVGATFTMGGQADIALIGVDIEPASPQIGASVRLTLHWQALRPVIGGWEVFVHLNGPGGARVNWDHRPLVNLHPIHQWQPGQFIRDSGVIELRTNLVAGPGEVWIGLWNPATGSRMLVLAAGTGKTDKDGRLLVATPTLR